MARVEVHFITNRNHMPDNARAVFGGQFNPDGVAALRFGKAQYDVDGKKAVFRSIDVYPDAKVLPGQSTVPPSGSGSFLDDLHKRMLAERDTLLFIHGYNVSFLEALEAGALLAGSLDGKLNVVVFSWPSDGKMVPYMSYYSDREDARVSGPALARAYLKLFDFVRDIREAEVRRLEKAGKDSDTQTELCMRCIHILAHSMGNYVLRHGVQAICAKDPRKVVRMFDQIIMAAADEDDDTFEHEEKLRNLPSLARRVTVYHNRNDRALVISDRTKANPDRLGSEGPRMLDMLPKKVVTVDCSRVASEADPRSRHSYYIRSKPVATDIREVLADRHDDDFGEREMLRIGRAYRLRPPLP